MRRSRTTAYSLFTAYSNCFLFYRGRILHFCGAGFCAPKSVDKDRLVSAYSQIGAGSCTLSCQVNFRLDRETVITSPYGMRSDVEITTPS